MGRSAVVRSLANGAGIAAAAALAYLPALSGRLLWNDSDYVTAPALRGVGGLRRIWFELGATQQYYPVLHSAFWAQHRLWGDAPLGYHLMGLTFHVMAAWLLAALLLRLRIPGAWLAAWLFALHPIAVESVAWITEQKNTLSLAFYLAAAIAYLRYDRTRSRWAYAGSFGLFLAACLSKSVTATLPGALLVLFWWRDGRLEWRRHVRPLLPWWVAGAGIGLLTAWVERHYIGAAGVAFRETALQRVLIAGRVVWFCLGHVLWPAHLTFIYPRWHADPAVAWQWLFPVSAVLVTFGLGRIATVRLPRGAGSASRRAPLACWLVFVGSLFPTLGFMNVYAFIFSFVADHWMYLASLAVIVPAAALLARGAQGAGLRGVAARCGAVALPVLLGVLAWRQSRIYRSDEVLYRATLARNPGAWMAHNNLGNLLRQRGEDAAANAEYHAAVALEPRLVMVWRNVGASAMLLGRTEEAEKAFRMALSLDGSDAEALGGIGGVFAAERRFAEAQGAFERAVAANPKSARVRYNFGSMLLMRREWEPAREQLEQAVELDPTDPGAHSQLGIAFYRLGRGAECVAELRKVVQLLPRSAAAHTNLANVLLETGQRKQAAAEYQAALTLDPTAADAKSNLRRAVASH